MFNYNVAVAGISNDISITESYLTNINEELSVLQDISDHQDLIVPEIENLLKEQNRLSQLLTSLNAVLNEINVIVTLNEISKTKLYDFYTNLDCSPKEFMIRLLFNYTQILIDIESTNLPILLKLIFKKYPIHLQYAKSLSFLYKYLH